jgi:RNA polymerase sigma-70 factor, ECF subfamily
VHRSGADCFKARRATNDDSMLNAAFPDVLQRARAGDEDAFALIYRDVQPSLQRYLRVRASGHEEDLSSETWLDVSRGLSRFVGDERGFRAWVFTIARGKTIDTARYNARRPTVPVEDAHESFTQTTRDVAEMYEEAEATAAALDLVKSLAPDQAEVILLRVVAGLDNGQIAQLLGKSPGAVRVLSHRGLRRLAKQLSQRVTGGV